MDLEKRIRMAAESILENESLREGLEDEGASALLDWGIACAKQIANDTANLEDEIEAEEASYPRMRALRQMLHIAVSLCTENMDEAEYDTLLEEAARLTPLVYGEGTVIPETSRWETPQAGGAQEKINNIRNLIENNPSIRKGD